MALNSKPNASTSFTAATSGGNAQALETSIRQLLANGNSKAALENAKQLHKALHTAESERLLLEAYRARIQSLLDQNLASEANALLELVEERFPNAKAVLSDVGKMAAAQIGDLAALLEPLNDGELSAERRAVIEQIIETQVKDLRALADCSSLPHEHSLRRAAAALDRAFDAVTSGPVTEEQIALPEVSHRSPLAPWKLLIRAIACLHRGEDEQCRDYLASVKAESVPARLVPAMHAILGMSTSGATLKPPESALVSRITANLGDLRHALEMVDHAFAGKDDGPVFKALRAAIRECQRSAPDRLTKLKQIFYVRGAAADLDPKRLATALDGEPRRDAFYYRMFARTFELDGVGGGAEDLAESLFSWDMFRQHSLQEGLFTAQSIEMAALYLHMADVLSQIPQELLKEFQRVGNPGGRETDGERDLLLLSREAFCAGLCHRPASGSIL